MFLFDRLKTLRKKCEDILKDDLTSALEESEGKLSGLFGSFKPHKPAFKPITNQNLKIKQENKEEIKKDKNENAVKPLVKDVLKEQVKEETLADILQVLSLVKRPSWSESRDDYKPLVYTSNLIIENPKADVDLLEL